jgi:predicted aspartyl protease
VGVFSVTVQIGDPQGERYEPVEAVVDTGASYTQLSASMLRRLGVEPQERRTFIMADGRREPSDVGQTWMRLDGKTKMTVVVFAEEGTPPLIGAVTLEEFGLGIDTVGHRLVPVDGYRLTRLASE